MASPAAVARPHYRRADPARILIRRSDGATEHLVDGAVSENTLSLNKTFVLFGIAALGMIAFAIVATMPTAGRLMARERVHTSAVPYRAGVAGSGLRGQPLRRTANLRRRLIPPKAGNAPLPD